MDSESPRQLGSLITPQIAERLELMALVGADLRQLGSSSLGGERGRELVSELRRPRRVLLRQIHPLARIRGQLVELPLPGVAMQDELPVAADQGSLGVASLDGAVGLREKAPLRPGSAARPPEPSAVQRSVHSDDAATPIPYSRVRMGSPASPKRRKSCLGSIALGLVSLAACTENRDSPRTNFVLISVDTLRADHLGAYGYPRATSPAIDRFAATSTRYANAWAPAPWTLPSHAALLTGRHPYDLGIRDLRSALPDGIPTLAEILAGAGYATAAFVDSRPRGFVGSERGFARGFEVFVHEPKRPGVTFRDDLAATVDSALAWLDHRDAQRPFFLFLHTKSVHAKRANHWVLDATRLTETDAPYDKPDPWRTRFLPSGVRFQWTDPADPAVQGARYLEQLNRRLASGQLAPADIEAGRLEELVALYDAGIAYVDEQFQRLLDGIAARDLAANTVVVLSADHGESFLEHRLFLHVELRPETLRVPLLVHDPRAPGGTVVTTEVGLVDVAPTLLARAGLVVPAGLAGRPLPTRDSGSAKSVPRLSYYHLADDQIYQGWALREGRWQLVLERWRGEAEPRAELFDLDADPGEHSPLTSEPDVLRAMRARLEARLSSGAGTASRSIELGADATEELRALGYVTE
jgi:arylsulfatase A-like enzyme